MVVTDKITHAQLVELVKEKGGVTLSEKDFDRMITFGRVYTKSEDGSKYTRFVRHVMHKGDLIRMSFETVAVDDNGSRTNYYVDGDGVRENSMTSHNLPLFDGKSFPSLAFEYQGDSWNK